MIKFELSTTGIGQRSEDESWVDVFEAAGVEYVRYTANADQRLNRQVADIELTEEQADLLCRYLLRELHPGAVLYYP